MGKTEPTAERLRKERDAAEYDKAITQRLLNCAASEIEMLADADCEDEAKDRALKAARRFRRAAQP